MSQSAKSESSAKPRSAKNDNTGPTADKAQSQRGEGPDRRETLIDRRSGMDRRQMLTREQSGYTGEERRVAERRRGPGRRLSDDRRSAEEGEMTAEQFEFVMAIETYKKVNKRLYPTWTEVLEVINQLGYRKVERRDIKLENVPEPELLKKTA